MIRSNILYVKLCTCKQRITQKTPFSLSETMGTLVTFPYPVLVFSNPHGSYIAIHVYRQSSRAPSNNYTDSAALQFNVNGVQFIFTILLPDCKAPFAGMLTFRFIALEILEG